MSRAANPPIPKSLLWLALFVVASVAALFLFAPDRHAEAARPLLPLGAPLPDAVPPGTTLVIGDPVTQWAFEHLGWDKQLPYRIRWVQITGGPDVTEAFHARALDLGVGASIPPVHATWVGLPVRIIAVRQRRDWATRPSWVWGLSPKAGFTQLRDLRGKRIAFSPSQVQSQVVIETLKQVGLSPRDVSLVELPSSIGGDVYTSALASGVIDAAPLQAGIVAERYLRKFARAGARVLPHPPFRDDLLNIYAPVHVLEDPAKAAAVHDYVRRWRQAQIWLRGHPDELARGYYVGRQGLPIEDARLVVDALGQIEVPERWDTAVTLEQAAIDTVAPQVGRPAFQAASLFDRRFEGLR